MLILKHYYEIFVLKWSNVKTLENKIGHRLTIM